MYMVSHFSVLYTLIIWVSTNDTVLKKGKEHILHIFVFRTYKEDVKTSPRKGLETVDWG